MTAQGKVQLPFRWPGGKFYALKILEQFIIEHDEYREPFVGGGSVFWSKPKVEFNWINDIDPDLIHVLNYISSSKGAESLVEIFNKENEPSKERHGEVKILSPENSLQRAFKYYYLNRTSYSGKMKNPSWGYREKRSLPPNRWHERIIPCSKKLKDVKVTCLDFVDVITAPARGKKILMFLDPPYFLAKQENHYVKSFKKDDHIRLANVLKETKYNFFLTYDDCAEIRELYSWANIYEINFFYRLDNSNNNGDKRKKGNELVITNYKIE